MVHNIDPLDYMKVSDASGVLDDRVRDVQVTTDEVKKQMVEAMAAGVTNHVPNAITPPVQEPRLKAFTTRGDILKPKQLTHSSGNMAFEMFEKSFLHWTNE